MPKYRIGVNEEVGAEVIVYAKNEEAAKAKALQDLEDNGMDIKAEVVFRECSIVS